MIFPILIKRKMTVINDIYSPFHITQLQPPFPSDLYIKVAPWCLHFNWGPAGVRRRQQGTEISMGEAQKAVSVIEFGTLVFTGIENLIWFLCYQGKVNPKISFPQVHTAVSSNCFLIAKWHIKIDFKGV